MIKSSKHIQIKITGIIAVFCCLMVFSGCSMTKQEIANANQTTNVNKPSETPKTTPQVKPSEEIEANDVIQTNTNKDKPDINQSKGDLEAKINQVTFEQITVGMTYEEVSKLFADKGMQTSTMKVNGRETEIFMWSNDDMSKYISLEFENKKVIEKKKKGF